MTVIELDICVHELLRSECAFCNGRVRRRTAVLSGTDDDRNPMVRPASASTAEPVIGLLRDLECLTVHEIAAYLDMTYQRVHGICRYLALEFDAIELEQGVAVYLAGGYDRWERRERRYHPQYLFPNERAKRA